MDTGDDERDVVRRSYDALSYQYRRDDVSDGQYGTLARRPAHASTNPRLGGGSDDPWARMLC
jgi:hypothetical protein